MYRVFLMIELMYRAIKSLFLVKTLCPMLFLLHKLHTFLFKIDRHCIFSKTAPQKSCWIIHNSMLQTPTYLYVISHKSRSNISDFELFFCYDIYFFSPVKLTLDKRRFLSRVDYKFVIYRSR